MILLIILAYAAICLHQIPALIEKRQIRDLVVFGLFTLAAFMLNILFAAGVSLPDPMKGVQIVLDALGLHF